MGHEFGAPGLHTGLQVPEVLPGGATQRRFAAHVTPMGAVEHMPFRGALPGVRHAAPPVGEGPHHVLAGHAGMQNDGAPPSVSVTPMPMFSVPVVTVTPFVWNWYVTLVLAPGWMPNIWLCALVSVA
jgi:hypothetical protein